MRFTEFKFNFKKRFLKYYDEILLVLLFVGVSIAGIYIIIGMNA